jgi:hypothetical protein
MQHPVLAFEVVTSVAEVGCQLASDARGVGRVQSIEPFIRTGTDFRFRVPQHRLPARRPVHFVGGKIPVPEPVVCPTHGKRVPLLAHAQILHRPFSRQMRGDPRRRDREINRFGDVVVGADLERIHDIGTLSSRGDHDDRKLGIGSLRAQPFQHLETAQFRHFHVDQEQVVTSRQGE